MLINTLPYTGQSPQQRIIVNKMFIVPRLGNSSIDVKLHFSHFIYKVLLYSQPCIFPGRHRFPWFLGPPDLLCLLWLSSPSCVSFGLLSGLGPGPLFRYPLKLKHSAYLLAVSLSLPFLLLPSYVGDFCQGTILTPMSHLEISPDMFDFPSWWMLLVSSR